MADDLSATCEYHRIIPGTLLKVVFPATADDTDYATITLADYGMARLDACQCFRHASEDNSIVAGDQPTTAVSSGVLTLTLAGSTDDKKRVVLLWGHPIA